MAAEIYERWVSAHGVILLAPTCWYQSPSPLKLMIDRLVCADGGNPDPRQRMARIPLIPSRSKRPAGTTRSTWPASNRSAAA
jgi:multimeric flavodoxin WrbA